MMDKTILTVSDTGNKSQNEKLETCKRLELSTVVSQKNRRNQSRDKYFWSRLSCTSVSFFFSFSTPDCRSSLFHFPFFSLLRPIADWVCVPPSLFFLALHCIRLVLCLLRLFPGLWLFFFFMFCVFLVWFDLSLFHISERLNLFY